MTKEQQVQVRKLCEQQGIKLVVKRTSADARIAALEGNLRVSSWPKGGDVKKTKGETFKEPAQGRHRGSPVVTHSPGIR